MRKGLARKRHMHKVYMRYRSRLIVRKLQEGIHAFAAKMFANAAPTVPGRIFERRPNA